MYPLHRLPRYIETQYSVNFPIGIPQAYFPVLRELFKRHYPWLRDVGDCHTISEALFERDHQIGEGEEVADDLYRWVSEILRGYLEERLP